MPSCAAAGFNAVGCITSLTALHVIRHGRFDARPPAAALTALSRLTRLRELRCEAGAGSGNLTSYSGDAGARVENDDERAQAKSWGTVLACMPHLTRLELVEVCVGDRLLCAVGSNAPQLQRLVLDREVWLSGSSKEGADAIAHVGHIELLAMKGFECSRNLQLLQLPGVKRVLCGWSGLKLSVSDSKQTQGGSVWSPERCKCLECWRRRN